MKTTVKRVLALALCFGFVLAVAACGKALPPGSHAQQATSAASNGFAPVVKRFSGDYSEKDYSTVAIKNTAGEDISADVIDLWYAANEVYNVDDDMMFEMAESATLFGEIEHYELKNYDEVVDGIFTANGKKQVEEACIGSEMTFIQRKDGKVYRLGPWKTGHSMAFALVDMQPKEVAETKVTVTAKYEKFAKPIDPEAAKNYIPEYELVEFTIVLENGIWMTDDYRYPEARS